MLNKGVICIEQKIKFYNKDEIKKFKFDGYTLYFSIEAYPYTNKLAVTCYTEEEPFSDITINLPSTSFNYIDEAFINSKCKNCGLYQALIDKGIIKEVTRENVPFNREHYDLVRFDLDKLKEYDLKGYYNYLDIIGFEEKISRTPKI